MGNGGGDGLRTMGCLRARLLAERVSSKAAKAEADLMAKRVEELERLLAQELECKTRAERRMKLALEKLESLKLGSVSEKPSSGIGQCGLGDDSSVDSSAQLGSPESSWSCVGTGHSRSGGATQINEASEGTEPPEGIDKSSRQSSISSSNKHQTELKDNQLAPALDISSLRLSSVARKPDRSSDVGGVLVALRHVRKQLQDSMERRTVRSRQEMCG